MSQIFVQETAYKSPNWGTQPKLLTVFVGLYEVDPSNRNINRETIRSKALEEYVRDAALKFYR